MRVNVHHSIGDLASDLAEIVPKAKRDMRSTVREGIRTGNVVARDLARPLSGRHAKDYPKTFSSQMYRGLGLFANVYAGEYGPAGGGQAFLPLERGNRNTKPQLALARSADLIGPSFAGEVARLPDGWFWT